MNLRLAIAGFCLSVLSIIGCGQNTSEKQLEEASKKWKRPERKWRKPPNRVVPAWARL
jgi:hypothetical protein